MEIATILWQNHFAAATAAGSSLQLSNPSRLKPTDTVALECRRVSACFSRLGLDSRRPMEIATILWQNHFAAATAAGSSLQLSNPSRLKPTDTVALEYRRVSACFSRLGLASRRLQPMAVAAAHIVPDYFGSFHQLPNSASRATFSTTAAEAALRDTTRSRDTALVWGAWCTPVIRLALWLSSAPSSLAATHRTDAAPGSRCWRLVLPRRGSFYWWWRLDLRSAILRRSRRLP